MISVINFIINNHGMVSQQQRSHFNNQSSTVGVEPTTEALTSALCRKFCREQWSNRRMTLYETGGWPSRKAMTHAANVSRKAENQNKNKEQRTNKTYIDVVDQLWCDGRGSLLMLFKNLFGVKEKWAINWSAHRLVLRFWWFSTLVNSFRKNN